MTLSINPIIFSVYIVIVVLNLFCSLSQREGKIIFGYCLKCKLEDFLAFCLIAFLILLIVLDRDNPDYLAYERIYCSSNFKFDSGYQALQNVFLKIGTPFIVFRTCIYLFGFYSIWHFFSDYINKNVIIALYAFFPFTYDAIQMRNFLSFAIILFFLKFLLEDVKISNVIWYVIGVLFAGSIHKLSYIYIVFLLIVFCDNKTYKINRNKLLGLLFILSFVFMMFCKLYSPARNILMNILNMVSNDTRAVYYTRDKMNWGFLGYAFIEILYIGSAVHAKRVLCKEMKCLVNNHASNMLSIERDMRFINIVLWLNISMSSCFALLLLGGELYRMYRNLSVISYASLAIVLKYSKNQDRSIAIILNVVAWLLSAIWQFRTDTWFKVFWIFFN